MSRSAAGFSRDWTAYASDKYLFTGHFFVDLQMIAIIVFGDGGLLACLQVCEAG